MRTLRRPAVAHAHAMLARPYAAKSLACRCVTLTKALVSVLVAFLRLLQGLLKALIRPS